MFSARQSPAGCVNPRVCCSGSGTLVGDMLVDNVLYSVSEELPVGVNRCKRSGDKILNKVGHFLAQQCHVCLVP